MAAAKKSSSRKGAMKKQEGPPPSGDAFNSWINFVLYAVTGLTSQGDALIVRHGGDIRSVARWLAQTIGVRSRDLYRGVLVEPHKIARGKLEHEEERKFLSWSEDKQVACWFADPRSIISEEVAQISPGARGYITRGKPTRIKILWHHSWREIPLPDGRTLPLWMAAAAHPEIDEGQFMWNLRTQREVITGAPANSGAKFPVEPLEKANCAPTSELDARYTYPPFLITRGLGG